MSYLRAEIRRLLQRPLLWLSTGGSIIVWGVLMYRDRAGLEGQQAWWDVYRDSLVSYHILLPLLVVMIGSTSLVDDRASGFIQLMMIRSLSRKQYLFTKFIATALVVAAVLTIIMVSLGLWIRMIGNATRQDALMQQLPIGFPQGPAAVIGTYAFSSALGGVCFLSIAMLASVLTKNRYVVASLPLLLHLGAVLLIPLDVRQLNPISYLQLNPYFDPITPLSMILFWVSGIGLCFAAATIIALRRERID